jgi:DNA-binding MarR family transcriptional regulator
MTNWAGRLFSRVIDRQLKELGVSSGMLPVFFALSNGKTLTQKSLAKLASIEQPTMAVTLSRMERDGLIVRQQDLQDGRSQRVSLTQEATEKAESVRLAVETVNSLAMENLAPGEADQLMATLEKVIRNLDLHLTESSAVR